MLTSNKKKEKIMGKINTRLIIIAIISVIIQFNVSYLQSSPSLEWKNLKTIHFNIIFPSGMENTAKITAQIAEEAYVLSGNFYKIEFVDAYTIILYDPINGFSYKNKENNVENYDFFSKKRTGPYNRIMAVFDGDYNKLRTFITSETAFKMQYEMITDNKFFNIVNYYNYCKISPWLLEGHRNYITRGFDHSSAMITLDSIKNEYIKKSNFFFDDNISYEIKIKLIQSFYYYFEKTYGTYSTGSLINNLKYDINFQNSISTITRKGFEDVYKDYINFFETLFFDELKLSNSNDENTINRADIDSLSSFYVSPDSTRVAFIEKHDLITSLKVMNLDSNKKIDFLKFFFLNNFHEKESCDYDNISWSFDSSLLIININSPSGPEIQVVDSHSGKVQNKIKFPFLSVRETYLSNDRNFLLFTAQTLDSIDLYSFDINNKKIKKITNDIYIEKNPILSPDGKSIYYISNKNATNKLDSNEYNIYCLDANTGKEIKLTDKNNNINPFLSENGSYLAYSSNKTGLYKIHIRNLKNNMETVVNSTSPGDFNPTLSFDGQKVSFLSYQNGSFHVKNTNLLNNNDNKTFLKQITEERVYPDSYLNLNDSVLQYKTFSLKNNNKITSGGTYKEGYGGKLNSLFSDDMHVHNVSLSAEYYNMKKWNKNDFNIDARYYFKSSNTIIGSGLFMNSFPQGNSFIGLDSTPLRYKFIDTDSIKSTGAFAYFSYYFDRYISNDIKLTFYEFDQKFSQGHGDKIKGKYSELKDSIIAENVSAGILGFYSGSRGEVYLTHTSDINSNYHSTETGLDIRQYFRPFNRLILSYKFIGGRIFSDKTGPVSYSAGGFNTIRGHDFGEFNGNKIALLNMEMLFVISNSFNLGIFPARGAIGVAIFSDTGSVWSNDFKFRNNKTGEFEDFKAGYGAGLRFGIQPSTFFKLDFAWPYYLKNKGNKKIMFSLGTEF